MATLVNRYQQHHLGNLQRHKTWRGKAPKSNVKSSNKTDGQNRFTHGTQTKW